MSIQVVGYHMFGFETSKAVSPLAQQTLLINVNAAASDVIWDLGNASGTFWTSALADATYGATAATCLASLQNLDKSSAFALAPGGNFTLYRVRDTTPTSTGDYAISSWTNRTPNFTFAAGDGPGSTNIVLTWGMPDGFQVQSVDVGL